MRGRLWTLALYLFVLGFILNLLGIVSHVTVSAFAKRWFGTPLPPQFTTDWFVYAWNNFDLDRVLIVTVIVALSVVVLAICSPIRRPIFWRGGISAAKRCCCCCTSCRWSSRK